MSEPRHRDERRQFVEELERQGLNFAVLNAEDLRKKLYRIESPIITSTAWSTHAPPGSAISYNVCINNPDPVQWSRLFVSVFVGLANLVPGVGEAVSAVDPRFPRLTMPNYPGLTLGPGAIQNVYFYPFAIPAGVENSNYLGNAILFQANYNDVGKVLDRGQFVFGVP